MMFPVFGTHAVDERFLAHRLKATSLAGIAGALVGAGLWAYQYYALDIMRWELLAVLATMAVVKVGMMVFYRVTR